MNRTPNNILILTRKIRTLSVAAFFLCNLPLHAQESINAGGGDIIDPAIGVSYSLGQPFFEPVTNAESSVTPGIQQAYEISIISGLPEITGLQLQAYPNPATDYLNLSFPGFNEKKYTMTLIDQSGRIIYIDEIKNELSQIEVQALASGVYFLQIAEKEQQIKVFKIIKK
jgi:hypothetical protein